MNSNNKTVAPNGNKNNNGGRTPAQKAARRRRRANKRNRENGGVSMGALTDGMTRLVNLPGPRGSSKISKKLEWLDSLLDPEDVGGLKIPDMVTLPSGSFQSIQDFQLTTGSGGDCLGFYFEPVIGDNNTVPPFYTGTHASADTLGWATAGWTDYSTYTALCSGMRCVSACLYAEFVGSTSLDQGTIYAAYFPRTYVSSPATINLPRPTTGVTAVIDAHPYHRAFPLRNGAYVRWKPQDNDDLLYKDPGGVARQSAMAIYVVGAEAATRQIHIRAVINWEVVARKDTTSMLATGPSSVNLVELERAMNYMGSFNEQFGPFIGSEQSYMKYQSSYSGISTQQGVRAPYSRTGARVY